MVKRDDFEHNTELEPNENGESGEESECIECRSESSPAEEPLPFEEVIAQLSAAEKQAQDNYERLLRVSAEFENYKKRTAREMQDVMKYANEKIAREMLTVVDNLERAIASASERCTSDDPLVQGVEITLSETLKLLEKHHVFPIQALGQPFDPNFHQAMMQEEVGDQPQNTVVRELQKGYMIHDRLLRPSLVAVSKSGGTKKENNGENASSENG
ncbi:MAG: nucleotide exchange factor GrpE [Desulfobacteraceae bacterium]|nr:MAG: nucleotide exchange factor GrpE [Desulfobacteraceae bacterium]